MMIDTTEFEHERELMQQRVFSSVAHDASTPLACILGSLQTLVQMKDKLSPQQHDSLVDTALDQAHRLDDLFKQILDKSKPQ